MSLHVSWAHVCVRCNHLASVHRGVRSWACQLCDCISTDTTDFANGISERLARKNHASEIAFLEREADEEQP